MGRVCVNRGSLARRCADLSVPKIRFDNNGDEVRLDGPDVMRPKCWMARWIGAALPRDRSSQTRHNKRHTSSGCGITVRFAQDDNMGAERQYGISHSRLRYPRDCARSLPARASTISAPPG